MSKVKCEPAERTKALFRNLEPGEVKVCSPDSPWVLVRKRRRQRGAVGNAVDSGASRLFACFFTVGYMPLLRGYPEVRAVELSIGQFPSRSE